MNFWKTAYKAIIKLFLGTGNDLLFIEYYSSNCGSELLKTESRHRFSQRGSKWIGKLSGAQSNTAYVPI